MCQVKVIVPEYGESWVKHTAFLMGHHNLRDEIAHYIGSEKGTSYSRSPKYLARDFWGNGVYHTGNKV